MPEMVSRIDRGGSKPETPPQAPWRLVKLRQRKNAAWRDYAEITVRFSVWLSLSWLGLDSLFRFPGLVLATIASVVAVSFFVRLVGYVPVDAFKHIDPEANRGQLFEIELCRDGVPYGRDVGVLRFEGDNLFFQGLRTTFSISSKTSHIYRSLSFNDRGSTYRFGKCRVMFRHNGRRFVVSFRAALGPSRRSPTARKSMIESELYQDLQRWSQCSARDDAVDVVPPITAAPDLNRFAVEGLSRVGFALSFPFLVAVYALHHGLEMSDLFAMSFVLSPCLLVWIAVWIPSLYRACVQWKMFHGRTIAEAE